MPAGQATQRGSGDDEQHNDGERVEDHLGATTVALSAFNLSK